MLTDKPTCLQCPHLCYDHTTRWFRCHARTGGGLGGAPQLKANSAGNPLRLANCRRTKEERGGSDV